MPNYKAPPRPIHDDTQDVYQLLVNGKPVKLLGGDCGSCKGDPYHSIRVKNTLPPIPPPPPPIRKVRDGVEICNSGCEDKLCDVCKRKGRQSSVVGDTILLSVGLILSGVIIGFLIATSLCTL